MPDNYPVWYALTFLSGFTHGELHEALDVWCADGAREAKDLLDHSRETWRAAGLSASQCHCLERAREQLPAAERAMRAVALAGLRVVTSRSAEYPPLLAATLGRARPPMLFLAGDAALLARPGVAMIGSRRPVAAALGFTRAAARVFGSHELTVVSGFAEGIDRCASGAALDAGGTTVLVLAQGLLTFRSGAGIQARGIAPFGGDSRALMRGIDAGRIAVVSAFPPRADWSTPQAMARNAMITALTRDVVVGQAGTSGGAWEAARMGLHQGRRVWVRQSGASEAGLGDAALASLGAHRVAWPGAKFDAWTRQLIKKVLQEYAKPAESVGAAAWTEKRVVRLLREGDAAEIHDASGLTGSLLLKIVDGRQGASLRRLEDLQSIHGLGPGAVEDVRSAFGLKPPRPQGEELSLFPDLDEMTGGKWKRSGPDRR
jgi:predicted Rossmann fold nucleotide-binding protein DprA/Smf involved in DNA uptake